MKPAKLMTNILPSYYAFIEKEAKKHNKAKRDILEEAIRFYMKEKLKEELTASYQQMAKDQEYLDEMTKTAEIGMDYFLRDIDK